MRCGSRGRCRLSCAGHVPCRPGRRRAGAAARGRPTHPALPRHAHAVLDQTCLDAPAGRAEASRRTRCAGRRASQNRSSSGRGGTPARADYKGRSRWPVMRALPLCPGTTRADRGAHHMAGPPEGIRTRAEDVGRLGWWMPRVSALPGCRRRRPGSRPGRRCGSRSSAGSGTHGWSATSARKCRRSARSGLW